jgi:hypothetical protein
MYGRKSTSYLRSVVMGFILQLFPIIAVVTISFGFGYGVREWIARRRRAAAREKFHRENPEYGR